jgi:hypothetical protein
VPELVRQPAREAACGCGCIASADDRYRLTVEKFEVTSRDEKRRRILKFREERRIEALAQCEKPRSELLDLCNFALGIIPSA